MAIGWRIPSLSAGLVLAGMLGCKPEPAEPCPPVEQDCDCPLDAGSPVPMDLPDCWPELSEFGIALDTAYRFTWQGVDMGHAAIFSDGHLMLDLMGTTTYTLDTDITHCRIQCTEGDTQCPTRPPGAPTGERYHLGGQHAIRCHGMGPQRLWRSRRNLPHRMKKGGLERAAFFMFGIRAQSRRPSKRSKKRNKLTKSR